MKITIELTAGNPDFTDDYLGMVGETARIPEVLADRIRASTINDLIGTPHPLHDALGSPAGTANFEGVEIVG